MRARLAAAVVIAGVTGVACGAKTAATPSGHERVAALDEAPLALLAHGDTVFIAAPAELARIDDESRAIVRLSDGRYRECPWDPSRQWGEVLSVAPQVTPDGRWLAMTYPGCGAWAWPLEGGEPIPIARANLDVRATKTDAAPLWDPVTNVPVARDGDGWIACGRQDGQLAGGDSEIWSLAADGTPRERIAEMNGECAALFVEPDALYVSNGSAFARFDRAAGTWTPLTKADDEFEKVTIAGATATHFVVVQTKRIERVPKIGGASETVASADPVKGCSYVCFAAAVDDRHVYWTDGESLSRAPNEDITAKQEILAAHDQRGVEVSRLPMLALTDNAIWLVTSEGPSFRERRPWLARVPKPRD